MFAWPPVNFPSRSQSIIMFTESLFGLLRNRWRFVHFEIIEVNLFCSNKTFLIRALCTLHPYRLFIHSMILFGSLQSRAICPQQIFIFGLFIIFRSNFLPRKFCEMSGHLFLLPSCHKVLFLSRVNFFVSLLSTVQIDTKIKLFSLSFHRKLTNHSNNFMEKM